jgi:hypothetical protein
MKFLRTISKVRPFVKTIGGLKQIIRRGTGVVLPKLSRMSLENKQKPIKIKGGKITTTKREQSCSIKPLKFLI